MTQKHRAQRPARGEQKPVNTCLLTRYNARERRETVSTPCSKYFKLYMNSKTDGLEHTAHARIKKFNRVYTVFQPKFISIAYPPDTLLLCSYSTYAIIAIYLTVVTMTILSDGLTAARKSYPAASGSCGVREGRHLWSKPSRALSRCLPKGYAGSTWRAVRWAAAHGVRPSNQMFELCHRRHTEQRAARWLVSSQTPHQNQVRSISQRPAESKCKRRRAVAAMSWWQS